MLSVTFATSTWSRNFDDTKHGGMNAKHNKVQRLYDTRTVKPYGKTISILSGYEPRLVDKPVQIKVEYARPRFISATVIPEIQRSTHPTLNLFRYMYNSAAEHAFRLPMDRTKPKASSRPSRSSRAS